MTTERAERRDPARTLELLWGAQAQPKRGPRPALSIERIVQRAIEVADAEGLAAVSMRRVADELGFTTMSLYRYVPCKDDLLELMVDKAAELPPPPDDGGDWRANLGWWARGSMAMYRARPWLLDVPLNGPPIGPNQVTWMDRGLQTMSGTGLTDGDVMGVLMLLSGYIRGHAQLASTLAQAESRTGVSERERDSIYGQMLQRFVTESGHPALARLVASGVFDDDEPDDEWLAYDFDFGLQRILDGVEALVKRREAQGTR